MPNRGKIANPSLSEVELREMWESGIPLDLAWIEFASIFDQFSLKALRTHPINDADVLGLNHPRYQQIKKGWLPQTWEGRQKKLESTTRNERANLSGEIYTGRLWAIGFHTLASGSDEAVRVPRQLFFVGEEQEQADHPAIHWSKGELTVGSDSYFDIRVVHAPVSTDEKVEPTNGVEGRTAEEREHAATKGRPKTSDQIREKVEELWTESHFQALPDRQAQAAEIRARLLGDDARHSHDTVGYATNTIKRIIGQVAKRPRKAE